MQTTNVCCVFVSVYTGFCVSTCVRAHTHQSQKSMWVLQLLIILCSEPVSLTLDLRDPSRLATQQVLGGLHVWVLPCDENTGTYCHKWLFFFNLDSRRIKACLHVSKPSTSPTEHFPSPNNASSNTSLRTVSWLYTSLPYQQRTSETGRTFREQQVMVSK